MKRFESILLAIDVASLGPADEELPLEVASAAAAAASAADVFPGSTVTLIAVVTEDPGLTELAERRLRASIVPLLGEREVTVVAAAGKPHVRIIQQVLRGGHDLLIVAARQQGLITRSIAGATAVRLITTCPAAVWVAPRRFEVGRRVVLSAVALHDLTPEVLEISATIVALRGGKWHVLHVPEYPQEGAMRLRDASRADVEAYERECRDAAWAKLHELCDPLAAETGVTPKLWMAEGRPSEQILLASAKLAADVVVMGTIGRKGLAGMLIGNTAERVFNSSECSVLAIKPAGFESPVKLDD